MVRPIYLGIREAASLVVDKPDDLERLFFDGAWEGIMIEKSVIAGLYGDKPSILDKLEPQHRIIPLKGGRKVMLEGSPDYVYLDTNGGYAKEVFVSEIKSAQGENYADYYLNLGKAQAGFGCLVLEAKLESPPKKIDVVVVRPYEDGSYGIWSREILDYDREKVLDDLEKATQKYREIRHNGNGSAERWNNLGRFLDRKHILAIANGRYRHSF